MIQLEWREVPAGDGPAINTSITPAETAKLAELASGKRVLEVGAAYGYSTVVLAQAAAHVWSVDPHQWLNSWDACVANVRAYGVGERVVMVPATSFVALPQMVDQGERFDLAFVDGDHAEATVTHDVGWSRKLLAPGGVLACHDYDEATCPGVRAALDRLLGAPPVLVDTLAVYEGFAPGDGDIRTGLPPDIMPEWT